MTKCLRPLTIFILVAFSANSFGAPVSRTPEALLAELQELPENEAQAWVAEKARELSNWVVARSTPRDETSALVAPLPKDLVLFTETLKLAAYENAMELKSDKIGRTSKAVGSAVGLTSGISGIVFFAALLAASFHANINFWELLLYLAGGTTVISSATGFIAWSGTEPQYPTTMWRKNALLLDVAKSELESFGGDPKRLLGGQLQLCAPVVDEGAKE